MQWNKFPGIAALRATAVAFILAPIFFWNGGVLETEGTYFITNYLDERTMLQKVFEPRFNDFDTYQGRELSHFIDYLDAHVFRTFLHLDFPIFIGASCVFASFALLAIHQLLTPRIFPDLSRVTSTLVLLLYLSGFVHLSTMGVYYRSAKPMLAPLLFLSCLLLRRYQDSRSLEPAGRARRVWLSTFGTMLALGLSISLLDRIGFFLVMMATGILGMHLVVRRGRSDAWFGVATAWAGAILYNRLVGPMLIKWINGYWPDLTFQNIRWRRIFLEPDYLRKGATLLVEQTWILFGSLPHWAWIALATIVAARWIAGATVGTRGLGARARGVARSAWSALYRLPVLCAIGVGIALVIMEAMLILRYPQIYDQIDHRLWYYAVPVNALLVFAALAFLNNFLSRARLRWRWGVNAVLVVMVISNVASWQRYKIEMLNSAWFPVPYLQTLYLKASIAERREDPRLVHPFLAFFRYCETQLPPARPSTEGHD